jgi:tetratricopeptide (TPR) repeat protein
MNRGLIIGAVLISLFLISCNYFAENKNLEKANQLFKNKDYESAIAVYDQVLAIDSLNRIALYNKALSLKALKKHIESIQVTDFLLKHFPDDPKYRYVRAGNNYLLENFESAKNDFTILLAGDNELNKNDLRLYRGLCFYGLEYYIQAIQDFSKVDLDAPESTKALYFRGRSYEYLNSCDFAIKSYEKAIEYGHVHDDVYYRLGICYEKLKQTQRALYYYNIALRKNPANGPASLRRGYIHFKKGMYNQAIENYSKVIELDSANTPKALKGRCSSYLVMDSLVAAEADLSKLNELIPADIFVVTLNEIISEMMTKKDYNRDTLFQVIYQNL